MIRFFSAMRNQLIKSERVNKYLLYGVGEIVLVVIGILIALQINNWNTQKSQNNELHGYLNNIAKNVTSDMEQLKGISEFRKVTIRESQKFLKIIRQEAVKFEDLTSLFSDTFVFNDRYFHSNTSGFEALKNSGYLGKIQGTELETKLYDYYLLTEQITEQEKSLNDFIESMEVLVFKDGVVQDIVSLFQSPRFTKASIVDEKKINELLRHPGFTGAHLRNSLVTNIPRYYEQLGKLGNEIIALISQSNSSE